MKLSISSLLSLAALLACCIDAAPTDARPIQTPKRCLNPVKRREWRTLTSAQKTNFIDAVKCLHSKPAINTVFAPGAVSRFDDFQAEHMRQTPDIHFTGHFLPWHRRFLALYETALREECGLSEGIPYWNWALDAVINGGAGIAASPIFSDTDGLGGNGAYVNCTVYEYNICIPGGTGGGCISTGPFADMVLHLGPLNLTTRNDHCIRRDFSPSYFEPMVSNGNMALTLSQPDYVSFWHAAEGTWGSFSAVGQHGAGHAGVSGTMLDVWSSPGDPAFYFHHGMLDKLWHDWQALDKKRLKDIGGPVASPQRPRLGLPPNPSTANVTLNFEIEMGVMGDTVKIKDLMDISDGVLCYEYV